MSIVMVLPLTPSKICCSPPAIVGPLLDGYMPGMFSLYPVAILVSCISPDVLVRDLGEGPCTSMLCDAGNTIAVP